MIAGLSLDPLYRVIGWLLAVFYSVPPHTLGLAIILLPIVVIARDGSGGFTPQPVMWILAYAGYVAVTYVVVFFNAALSHLYVAIGDPGVIDVIDVAAWSHVETISTERGAHTIGLDASANRVYAFLPQTHRAAVYQDQP